VLIDIPYWWDGKKESLKATISSIVPGTFPDSTSAPIPLEPPRPKPDDMIGPYSPRKISSGVPTHENLSNWLLALHINGTRSFYDGKGNLYFGNNKDFRIRARILQE
jgi:hypothetical protein